MDIYMEEDEVVNEYDVYLSKDLSDNLVLVQYPTRPATRDYEYLDLISSKYKPIQKKLEVELGINVKSCNYDRNRGGQIAHKVDGSNSGEPYFNSSKMDKYIFTSTKCGKSVGNYAIGILREDGLHLTPLKTMLSMRPSFAYLDKLDAQAKKDQMAGNAEEELDARPVTVRFERPNAGSAKPPKQTYSYLQNKNLQEQWIDLSYHPLDSPESKAAREKLLCQDIRADATNMGIPPEEYVKQLAPGRLHFCSTQYYIAESDMQDSTIIRAKPLSDQLKYYMINAHVMTFSMLLSLLPPNTESVSVERLLQQYCVLVQGCWAIKSELLYPDDSVSPFSGVKAETLRVARDYMLWKFVKLRYITRGDILSVIQIPSDDLDFMISNVAIKNGRKWDFKFPYDEEFIKNHRSLETGQEMKWEFRYKKLVKELQLCQSDGEGGPRKVPVPVAARQKQKRHSRSSMSEEGEESGIENSPSNSREPKIVKRNYSTKKRSNSGPTKHGGKPNKQIQIATLDVSPTYLETSLSDELRLNLQNSVGDAMKSHFSMTLSELKELITESSFYGLANRSDFETVLHTALIACGAERINNKWPQNADPEPIYAFVKFGNKTDRYRKVLLDLFTNTARSRINFLVKKVEDELGEIISESDCRQIFEEYCIYKSGFYYLKGTIAPDP